MGPVGTGDWGLGLGLDNNIEESLEHVVISRSEHYHFLTFYVILILQARRDLGDNTFISIM